MENLNLTSTLNLTLYLNSELQFGIKLVKGYYFNFLFLGTFLVSFLKLVNFDSFFFTLNKKGHLGKSVLVPKMNAVHISKFTAESILGTRVNDPK